MTYIEVNESTDNEIYTFIIKQKAVNSVVDLSSYTSAIMTLVSNDLKTSYGTITLGFGTKADGEVTYTTDTTDPYPSIPGGTKYINLIGQIKISDTGLVTITDDVEIRLYKDYTTI